MNQSAAFTVSFAMIVLSAALPCFGGAMSFTPLSRKPSAPTFGPAAVNHRFTPISTRLQVINLGVAGAQEVLRPESNEGAAVVRETGDGVAALLNGEQLIQADGSSTEALAVLGAEPSAIQAPLLAHSGALAAPRAAIPSAVNNPLRDQRGHITGQILVAGTVGLLAGMVIAAMSGISAPMLMALGAAGIIGALVLTVMDDRIAFAVANDDIFLVAVTLFATAGLGSLAAGVLKALFN